MSQATQNAAEVVRAGYAVLNAADLEALDRIFASDASWHTPGRSAIAGVREGKDAVFQQFGRYCRETDHRNPFCPSAHRLRAAPGTLRLIRTNSAQGLRGREEAAGRFGDPPDARGPAVDSDDLRRIISTARLALEENAPIS